MTTKQSTPDVPEALYLHIAQNSDPIDPEGTAASASFRAIVEAAYLIGRADAAAAIRGADTSGWPGGRGGDVDGCQERAARVAEGAQ